MVTPHERAQSRSQEFESEDVVLAFSECASKTSEVRTLTNAKLNPFLKNFSFARTPFSWSPPLPRRHMALPGRSCLSSFTGSILPSIKQWQFRNYILLKKIPNFRLMHAFLRLKVLVSSPLDAYLHCLLYKPQWLFISYLIQFNSLFSLKLPPIFLNFSPFSQSLALICHFFNFNNFLSELFMLQD